MKEETGGEEKFGEFIADLMAHKDVREHYKGESRTPEEVAMVVIAAQLSQNQFDHLCKHSAFIDETYSSRKLLSVGMKAVADSLPEIFFMQNPFPGCCFDPLSYLTQQLEEDGSLLEFHPGPLEDAVLIMRAGDGSGDGKFPMYTECYNLPQMEACQEVRHCHVTANGRFVESVEGEHLHLTTYYTKWDEVNKAEVEVCGAKKRIVQAYGGDGADLVKKKGTAGFSSHHWCPHCHADQSCKHKLTFLHPEIKPRVQAYREWEHDGCKAAGVCVCTEFGCAKALIAKVRAHVFKKWPKLTMEGGRGKEDGNRWDPEHMQHPKHDEIGKWAQTHAYGQVI